MDFKPHHTAISVRDLDKSQKFYELLGYKQVHHYDEEDGSMSIVHMKLGDSFLEIFNYVKNQDEKKLQSEIGNNLEQIGVKHLAVSTEDIEKALAKLKKIGLANKETEITFGRTKVSYFFIQDPDGIWVEIIKDDRYK